MLGGSLLLNKKTPNLTKNQSSMLRKDQKVPATLLSLKRISLRLKAKLAKSGEALLKKPLISLKTKTIALKLASLNCATLKRIANKKILFLISLRNNRRGTAVIVKNKVFITHKN